MPNERLRATLLESGYDERTLADELGLDHKSVQRWITRDVTPPAHRRAPRGEAPRGVGRMALAEPRT
jgi:hypothetical protein